MVLDDLVTLQTQLSTLPGSKAYCRIKCCRGYSLVIIDLTSVFCERLLIHESLSYTNLHIEDMLMWLDLLMT